MKKFLKEHVTRSGKKLNREILVDDLDVGYIKKVSDSIRIDVTNDFPLVFDKNTNRKQTLGQAILKNRKIKTKRKIIDYKNGNHYDVRIANLNY
jgi:hypothetical protein